MKKTNVIKMLAIIKANYRYTYKDMTAEEMSLLADTWHECLKTYGDDEVGAAFKVSLTKCPMPPTIADIMGSIKKMRRLKEPSDFELWDKLQVAVNATKQQRWSEHGGFCELFRLRNSECHKIYDTLPKSVRKYCNFSTFCGFGGLTDAQMAIERSRFLKNIPQIRESLSDLETVAGNNVLTGEQLRLESVYEA